MSAMKVTVLLVLGTALVCLGLPQGDPVCDDELNSSDLSRAIDAAITSLMGEPGWLLQKKVQSGYTHALDIYSCTPDKDKWHYPRAEEATGLLKRVIDSGELRVAGVKWSLPGAADYVTNPEDPTGFWPEYLKAVVAKLSEAYGKEIKLIRKYYQNSDLVVDAVKSAEEVEMSEPYYYLSGFYGNVPRIEAFGFSCATAGTASQFYTLKKNNITSLDVLADGIENGNKLMGFIGKGNYDSVSSALPSSVIPVILTNSTEISNGVLDGTLIAGYLSEGANPAGDVRSFNVFPSGIISPRTFLFRKELPRCLAESSSNDTAVELVIIIVLAVAALILAGILSVVIVKERKGSPLFMPLLPKNDESSQQTSSI